MFSLRKSKSSTIVLITLFLLSAFSHLTAVHAAQLTWTVQTVDAAADVGMYTSLALDSAGNLHASYWDGLWRDLKYTKLTGSTWSTPIPVDTIGDIGYSDTSIQVDSSTNPHISYCDYGNGDLKYAQWNGINWSVQTVDSLGFVGLYSSLVLDSSDRPCISYYDASFLDLKYAHWTGSGWSVQTVDSAEATGLTTSLDLDTSDRPHIAYWELNVSTVRLKYAYWDGSVWNFEIVTTGGIGSDKISLKLDSNNNPHISYYETASKNLMYAKKTGPSWTTEVVDASQAVGAYSSLALDSNDSPHIAYYDVHWQDLKYAKLTDYGWFIKNVDNVGDVGAYPSLALDSTDHPQIVYRDESNKNLKYARDPDETFGDILWEAFDSDADLKADSVKYTFDVDTTYSGTLSVFVFAGLIDEYGQVWASNSTVLSITSNQPDSFNLVVNLPQSAQEGDYGIFLTVKDDGETLEDYILGSNDTSLSPPQTNQNGILTGTVTDQDWGHPISGAEVQIGDLYTYTNSTGQYQVSLPTGFYNVTVSKDLYLGTTIIDVSVVAETITTQDIVLERWFYYLDLQVQGSGSLNPPAAFYMAEAGSTVEVQATSDSGWTFAYWLFDLVNAGSENPYSFLMDNDHALKAVFIEELHVGFFNGTVIDAETDIPIGEARIIIDFATFLTDPAGNFELELEATEYTVFVEANGYQSQERQIIIEPGGNTEEIFLLQHIESAMPLIESSNSVGDQKDFFDLGENVYVTGNGYEPSSTYNLYFVEDVEIWSEGMTIPPRVLGTATQISSNSEGVIFPMVVWSNPQVVGNYDIVVDVNSNGVYDPEVDALDDGDVEVTAGMVIPEFSHSLFLSVLIILTFFAVFISKNHNTKSKKQYSS